MEVSKEQHEAHVIEYISKQIESQNEEYDKEQYISLMDKLLPPYKKQLFGKFIKGEGFKYKIMANDNLEHFSQWAFQRFSGFISLDSYESYTSYYAFREEIKKANKGRDLFYKDEVIEVPPYKYERNPKYEQYLCLLAFLERYIDRARITSVFGEKRTKTEHLGIDIASRDGGTIRAIKEGIVYNAGYSIDYGFFVDVLVKEKGDKYVMRYAHLAKRPELKKGRRVKEGSVIGYMGKTGKAYGTHLHLEFLVFSDNGHLVPVDALQKMFEIIEQKKALLDESNVALNQADKRKE
jgi:murein DD-endopeptidase MepM/ murein hydrolase activator NlpD